MLLLGYISRLIPQFHPYRTNWVFSGHFEANRDLRDVTRESTIKDPAETMGLTIQRFRDSFPKLALA